MTDTNAVRFALTHRLDAIRDAVDLVQHLVYVEVHEPQNIAAARVASERGADDLKDALTALQRVSDALMDVKDGIPHVDPYGCDDFGPLEEPSHGRDFFNARKGTAVAASPFAPDPATAGTAAFGVSRITADNPFANVFAPRGAFGYVAQ